MIKTALKFNIVLFMLILIVSIPVVYADWSELTVVKDTNIITYEERAFLRENEPAYYIDYVGEKPYIRTNLDVYNIWNFGRVYSQSTVQYDLNRDTKTLIIKKSSDGYISFLIDVEPSQAYYFSFDVDCEDPQYTLDYIKVTIEFLTQSGSASVYYDWYLNLHNEFSFITRSTTRRLRIRFYKYYYPNEDIMLYNFWLNTGIVKRVPEYINRPAETYVYEHSDYTRIGAIILDGYNQFVDSLLNPLDTITGWLKDLGNYIWSTIKRIIDPEGIFLK